MIKSVYVLIFQENLKKFEEYTIINERYILAGRDGVKEFETEKEKPSNIHIERQAPKLHR